jgi:beta-galactosidase
VLAGLEVDGRPLVLGGLRPTLWRAPTDNDGPGGEALPWGAGQLARWRAEGLDRLVADLAGGGTDGSTSWRERGSLLRPDGRAVARLERSCTVTEEGVLLVDEVLDVLVDDVPRVGTTLVVAAGLEHLELCGLGPDDAYPDRLAAATFGRWRSTVAEQLVPYVHPQEHGSHAGTTWLALTDDDGAGLLLVARGGTLHASARHAFDADLEAAKRHHDLRLRPEVEVHLDAAVRGLGTASCGPDTAPEHRLAAGGHRWSWAAAALVPGDDPAAVAAALR